MELPANQVFDVLQKKGITSLYHANTVQTACGFLSQGKLLSRGTQSELMLPMSDQLTDGIDVQHGLWYEVFVDTVDIHHQMNKRNNYGPVLFELDISLLNRKWMPFVWIMKSNPSRWTPQTTFKEKYFATVSDFDQAFSRGDVDKLFSFRTIGGVVRLKEFLTRIIVDKGGAGPDRAELKEQAIGALYASAQVGGLPKPAINIRECQQGCTCNTKYSSPQMALSTYKKFFAPYGA